jgi:hypothetical protein
MRSTVTMWGPAVKLASVRGQNERENGDTARSLSAKMVKGQLRRCSSAGRTALITALCAAASLYLATAASALADGEGAPTVTAKDVQNPVASLATIPFQNNTYFNVGPYKKTEDVLAIEPVKPFRLGDDWNLITRTIIPVVYQPQISPLHGSTFGISNLNPQFYLTPVHPGPIIWGIGPQLWLPTATDHTIGVNKLGAGPAAVVLTIQGPWLLGLLANQVWAGHTRNLPIPINTFAGDHVNQLTLNPFIFYNMPKGWYFVSSTVSVAQWDAPGRDVWSVPVGGGIGRVFEIGKQAVNMRIQGMDEVHRPQYDPTWQLQVQLQLLFPVAHH